MKMRIFYIGHYVDPNNPLKYKIAMSGVAKMEYIIYALKRAGFYINVYSLAPYIEGEYYWTSNCSSLIDENEKINYPFCFRESSFIFKVINRIIIYSQFLFFCLFKIKKSDKILVYHSWQYRYIINILRMLGKKFYFEIEEIYNAAWNKNNDLISKEILFLQKSSGYIFINDIIADKCGFEKNIGIVCYGDYRIKKKNNILRDKTIRLIYAGFIGDKSEDVYLALEVMQYLPIYYELGIIGYGSTQHINDLENRIEELNILLKRNAIHYDGCLYGKAYEEYVSGFNIGLCPRRLSNDLSDYTFPSKVLSYLGLGIIPVCARLSCLEKSKIANDIYFFKSLEPSEMAKVIINIRLPKVISRNIDSLDHKFISELKSLF